MMKGGSSRGNLHLGKRSQSHKFWSTAAFIIKTFRFECHGLFKVQISVILSKVVLMSGVPGNTDRSGRLSTVDLLIEVACFVEKVNNGCNFESR
jgi:hypothetical protein